MQKSFETPEEFDRALKRAVSESGGSGDLYRQMLRDRFLCRVFSDGDAGFILKGGSGLLARIPDARATRDVDFATRNDADPERVMGRLSELVSRDLGDWCRFELTKMEEAIDENGYSRLLKLRYATFIGEEEKDPVLIDLSLDCSTTQPPERVSPANRVEIAGVDTCDYLVYPLPDQLADKLCAIMDVQPGGWPSSRMKDLVDVVTYVTHETFSLAQLSLAVESECARRGMDIPEGFAAPSSWELRFRAFARKNGMPGEYCALDAASRLASDFFGPALLNNSNMDARWDRANLRWVGFTAGDLPSKEE